MEAPSETRSGALSVIRHLLKAMRPVQWVKNVFVLAPLVFGLELGSPVSLARAFVAFAAFCLVSSAVYLLNDLMDREQDRRHPTKRHRPIASGALPLELAKLAVGGLVCSSLGIGLALDWRVASVLGSYFLLNVAYTTVLKHIAFVDITCIALGFLFRVLAGGLATRVDVSIWLLACTFMLASLLALGKRRHELIAVGKNGSDKNGAGSTRAVLDRYRVEHIDLAMRVLALVTVASYTLYTLSDSTWQHFHTRSLVWSVPFVVFGLFRFNHLMGRHDDAQSPTDTMVRDTPFLVNVGLWGAFVTAVIYFGW